MKKWTVIIIILFLSAYTIDYIISVRPFDWEHTSCPFCDPQVVCYQQFYEDDVCRIMYNYKPITPGHCMIIPKRHVEAIHELSPEEISHMCSLIPRLHHAVTKVFHTDKYLLLQKNGAEVGQTVPHVHIHYIPRQVGHYSTLCFWGKILKSCLSCPLRSEAMGTLVTIMKEAMDEQEEALAKA